MRTHAVLIYQASPTGPAPEQWGLITTQDRMWATLYELHRWYQRYEVEDILANNLVSYYFHCHNSLPSWWPSDMNVYHDIQHSYVCDIQCRLTYHGSEQTQQVSKTILNLDILKLLLATHTH